MQSKNTQKTLSNDTVINIYKYTDSKYGTGYVLVYKKLSWYVDGLEKFEQALKMLNDGYGWPPNMQQLMFIETISKQTHPHYFI